MSMDEKWLGNCCHGPKGEPKGGGKGNLDSDLYLDKLLNEFGSSKKGIDENCNEAKAVDVDEFMFVCLRDTTREYMNVHSVFDVNEIGGHVEVELSEVRHDTGENDGAIVGESDVEVGGSEVERDDNECENDDSDSKNNDETLVDNGDEGSECEEEDELDLTCGYEHLPIVLAYGQVVGLEKYMQQHADVKGTGEEYMQQYVDIETRFPIPNERAIRMTLSNCAISNSNKPQQIQIQNDVGSGPTPFDLPFTLPGLTWMGHQAMTTSQLLAQKESMIASTSRNKVSGRRGRG